MKVKTIHYERLQSEVGYNHRKLGITIDLDEGDEPAQVVKHARAFVHRELGMTHGPIAIQMPLPEEGSDDDPIPF